MGRRTLDRKRPDVAEALKLGWSYVGLSGGNHYQFTHPGYPRKLTLAESTRNSYTIRNGIALVRRLTPREVLTA